MSTGVFFATKLLQELLFPFNQAIGLLLLGWFLLWRNRIRPAKWLLGLGIAWLIVPSTGAFSYFAMRGLETAFPIRKAADYSEAAAIVVLGGTTGPLDPPRLEPEEMYGARLQMAARLFRAGRAPRIVVAGGAYTLADGSFRTEAEDMRDVLVGMGVPESAIALEKRSRNTFENALYVVEMLKDAPAAKVLLVTSAFHLPRAASIFAKQGVHFEPVPCSFTSAFRVGLISGAKPEASNLMRSETALKEYFGRLAYWLMGKA
jgi:uncharacterized SAM-binding protein YcdF (DUF218 family)